MSTRQVGVMSMEERQEFAGNLMAELLKTKEDLREGRVTVQGALTKIKRIRTLVRLVRRSKQYVFPWQEREV